MWYSKLICRLHIQLPSISHIADEINDLHNMSTVNPCKTASVSLQITAIFRNTETRSRLSDHTIIFHKYC
jgi:hypothetical protein